MILALIKCSSQCNYDYLLVMYKIEERHLSFSLDCKYYLRFPVAPFQILELRF